jgi:hypothetical protein
MEDSIVCKTDVMKFFVRIERVREGRRKERRNLEMNCNWLPKA